MTNSDQLLAGKVALITEGGRGIGRAIALAYADAGTDIAVVARTQSQLDEVAGEVKSRRRRSIGLDYDMTDYDAVAAMTTAFAAEFDRQAILINNAGGNHESRPVLERDSERWVKGVELNLFNV